MKRKDFKEISKAVDNRVVEVIESFNLVIEEYEENGKTEFYENLLESAKEKLITVLFINSKMSEILKEEHNDVVKSNLSIIKKAKRTYWIAKVHNYYVACSEVLIECAKENGIIEKDAKKISIKHRGGEEDE